MSRSLRRILLSVTTLFAAVALLGPSVPRVASAGEFTAEESEISAGGQANLDLQNNGFAVPTEETWSGITVPPQVDFLLGGPGWSAINFIGNATQTGFYQIPPDPIGTVGPDRAIDVVNSCIESWTKAGAFQWRASVSSLFAGTAAPGALGTTTFDPRIVYDQYAGRFVVVCLEQTTSPQASRILVAVSKTSSPASGTAADWWRYSINSMLTIAGSTTWADYPGVEIDEDAIYVTTNMFRFTNASAGQRLWIVHKGLVGGLYAGGAGFNTVHDYFAAVPGSVAVTMMPALVFGAAGAGPGIGTYLCGYSGLTSGGLEFVEVIRVNDPVGVPTFTGPDFVAMGDIDTAAGTLPRGPQLGSAILIDTGDRRAQDAVWRNNALWVAATVNPPAGADAGQSTAHWFKIDTSAIANSASAAGLLTTADQGDIGANALAAAANTAYLSVAVNNAGAAKFDFAIFAASIYGSAGLAGREAADPAGTVQGPAIWKAGVDSYVRTFTSGSTGRNRWGDYSGVCVDPTDDRAFWLFNQWADVHGNPTTVGTTTEDGQWATRWMGCAFACMNLTCPVNVDAPRGHDSIITFCIENCAPFTDTFNYQITNQLGWCPPLNGSVAVPAGQTVCISDTCAVPADAPCDFVKQILLVSSDNSGLSRTCDATLVVDCGVPTRVAEMGADAGEGGTTLHWSLDGDAQYLGFHVFREEGTSGRIQLTQNMLAGGTDFSYFDPYVSSNPVNYWIAEYGMDRSTTWYGPIVVEPTSALSSVVTFSPAMPNPFGVNTTFAYALPTARPVHLGVYDAAGRLVKNLVDGEQSAGAHTITWDGQDASGRRASIGLYLVVLNAGGEIQKQKVLLGR